MKNLVHGLVALVALRPAVEWAVEASFSSMEAAVHSRIQEQDLMGLRLLSPDELADERIARKKRMCERRQRARDLLKNIPPPEQVEPMSQEDVSRHLSWFGGTGSSSYEAFSEKVLADPSVEYDKWAQAYRMLGGYIDCDHNKDGEGGSGSGDANGGAQGACSRWMIWAAVRNRQRPTRFTTVMDISLTLNALFCLFNFRSTSILTTKVTNTMNTLGMNP